MQNTLYPGGTKLRWNSDKGCQAHDLDARLLSRGDRLVRLLGGTGERLFDHAVFARFGSTDDVFTVKLGFRGNADGINVIAGEKLIQVGDEFDAEVIGGGLSALGVGVPDCAEIDAVVFLRGVADAMRVPEPKGELGESDVWHGCSLSLSDATPTKADGSYPIFSSTISKSRPFGLLGKPIYIRGLELTIVGILFGIVFLRFGVWATIISHHVYNCFLGVYPMVQSDSLYFKVSGITAPALISR